MKSLINILVFIFVTKSILIILIIIKLVNVNIINAVGGNSGLRKDDI